MLAMALSMSDDACGGRPADRGSAWVPDPGNDMETAYDWITVALFAMLATTFLQRSVGPRPSGDRTLIYLPPALGCAVADQLGNGGHHVPAAVLILLAAFYIWNVLRPGRGGAPH